MKTPVKVNDYSLFSDNYLWQMVLIPVENQMPEELKIFLKECEKEFFKRKIKLVPIMNCKH